ncbi:MAG: hypothetical protein L3J06_04165 [Cyclobacteriaceae bacterium]|nr:hypothetical protein [Cyclobacteriaceae bacterium]
MYLSQMIIVQSLHIEHYYRIYQQLPKNKKEYDSYMLYTKDPYLINFMDEIEYDFFYDSVNNEFNMYGYGFDNVDDKGENFYSINNVNYIKSLFIKGDVLLSTFELSEVKNLEKIERTHFYSPNSMVELPNVEMNSFLKIIGDFKSHFYTANFGIGKSMLLKPGVTNRYMLIGKMIKNDEFVFSIDKDFTDTDTISIYFLNKEISKLKLHEKYKITLIYMPINLANNASDFYE